MPHPQPRGLRAVPGLPLSPDGLAEGGRPSSKAMEVAEPRIRGKEQP